MASNRKRTKKKAPRRASAWAHDPELEGIVDDIARALVNGEVEDREGLQRAKMSLAKPSSLDDLPTNSMILDLVKKRYPKHSDRLKRLLLKKPSRTLSGVSVVAAMTSPYPCPHGRCIFCPGGPDGEKATPQSYTGKEPAAMRAGQNDYDPYRQVKRRLEQLEDIGHPTDKVDLILMGGTITARPLGYQIAFVKGCLDGMNDHVAATFQEASDLNERASRRCIGMTFETRPDWLSEQEADLILNLGGTRVELGVQSAFDGPLEACRRGHDTSDSVEATRISKDCGLKVCHHLMPGMPGSTRDMDLESARRIFGDGRYRPDMIKIYPTLVIKGTELYEMWKGGEYEPLTTGEAAKLVAEIKRITPPWVRIMRVQRDIPSPLVEGGVKRSNLRQMALDVMEEHGWRCRCIRCREIGRSLDIGKGPDTDDEIEMKRIDYEASGGREVFISFDNERTDSLIGFLRLRRPSAEAHREEVTEGALVRELKVFGSLVPIGKKWEHQWQHRSYGKKLMVEAERVAREDWGMSRLLVTSGIGVRKYYGRLGYRRVGPYMGKELR